MSETIRLYTFTLSHFCEKARWALDHAGADYREIRFLVGDSFSRADLTLAALSAPLLRPREHPWRLPDALDRVPVVGDLARRLRDTAAGRHALESYARRREARIRRSVAAWRR